MNPRPTTDEMFRAMIDRDTSLDGVFVAAVRTTGIFCRPGCGAKKPRRENVEFFSSPREAIHAGYRACRRCRPMELGAPTRPEWVDRALEAVEHSADRRVDAAALRAMGIAPEQAARWFKAQFGMTFQGYCRARRMGEAMRLIRDGVSVGRTAARSGYGSESGFREAFERVFGAAPSAARREASSTNGASHRGSEPGGTSTGRATSTDAVAGTVAERGLPRELVARWIETPIGPMLAAASDDGIALLEFVDRRALATQITTMRRRSGAVVRPGTNSHIERLARELDAYFAGRGMTFTLSIDAPGTPFQAQVWEALRSIPIGETRSYRAIAEQIGRPTATRAVARANGDNRLAILIPCHRVIGADGALTGYGGGVWRKEWLLEHERVSAKR